MDKRALKELVLNSSWRHLAKERPKYLNFSPVRHHLLWADKTSSLQLSQNSWGISTWGRLRGWGGRKAPVWAQLRPGYQLRQTGSKYLESGLAQESCRRRRCGEVPAWQMTSLSPTYKAP